MLAACECNVNISSKADNPRQSIFYVNIQLEEKSPDNYPDYIVQDGDVMHFLFNV